MYKLGCTDMDNWHVDIVKYHRPTLDNPGLGGQQLPEALDYPIPKTPGLPKFGDATIDKG